MISESKSWDLSTAKVPSVADIEGRSVYICTAGFSKVEIADMLAVVLTDLGMSLEHVSARTKELFWDK